MTTLEERSNETIGGIPRTELLLPEAKVAEREGFEPPEPFGSMVFKTTAFDHSAISPLVKVQRISYTKVLSTMDFVKSDLMLRMTLRKCRLSPRYDHSAISPTVEGKTHSWQTSSVNDTFQKMPPTVFLA